jgi:DNA invertase Pin-like site-specific DNA recombinase
MYMELIRKKGVRFIAVENNIDSIYPETLEYAPFINIMSEMYARDTSRKIKAVLHSKGKSGKPLRVCY